MQEPEFCPLGVSEPSAKRPRLPKAWHSSSERSPARAGLESWKTRSQLGQLLLPPPAMFNPSPNLFILFVKIPLHLSLTTVVSTSWSLLPLFFLFPNWIRIKMPIGHRLVNLSRGSHWSWDKHWTSWHNSTWRRGLVSCPSRLSSYRTPSRLLTFRSLIDLTPNAADLLSSVPALQRPFTSPVT